MTETAMRDAIEFLLERADSTTIGADGALEVYDGEHPSETYEDLYDWLRAAALAFTPHVPYNTGDQVVFVGPWYEEEGGFKMGDQAIVGGTEDSYRHVVVYDAKGRRGYVPYDYLERRP